jgi:ATP-dependent Clp endopeptidase proteolytic subunit ClpP
MAASRTKSDTRDETKLLLELTELWHERGIDLPTRTVYLGTESVDDSGESGVDARLAERVQKNLHVLEAVSHAPITLLLNNVGGDVYHGLAIFDAIRESSCEVHAIVRGHAMSMGSWILQACDRRSMSAHATQMIHCGYDGFVGHSRTFEKWAAEAKRLTQLMESMYLARIREKKPRFSLTDLRELLDHDTFLSAERSVELGLADEVL